MINADGTLAPKFLEENLDRMGYDCNLCFGSLTDLEYHVSRGTLVIVLIRISTYQDYLHYVPVVGYDDDYIYVSDSLDYMVNVENEEHYNRKIKIDNFKKLWKTDTFLFNNIYLTIDIK